jgi:hypothetical protein
MESGLFDMSSGEDFFLAGEQGDLAHLHQVHSDRVLGRIDEAIVFGTDVREGGPSVCTFGADAPLACAVGEGGFDQLRWLPQPDGGAVALAVRGSAGGVLRFAAGGAPLAWVEDRSWASALSGGDRPLAAVARRSKSPRGPYMVGTNQITYLAYSAAATGSLAGGLGDAVLAVVEDESPCGWALSLFAGFSLRLKLGLIAIGVGFISAGFFFSSGRSLVMWLLSVWSVLLIGILTQFRTFAAKVMGSVTLAAFFFISEIPFLAEKARITPINFHEQILPVFLLLLISVIYEYSTQKAKPRPPQGH